MAGCCNGGTAGEACLHLIEPRFAFSQAQPPLEVVDYDSMSRPSAWDLAQIVSESIFHFAWLVEAACVQCLDSRLGRGSPERSNAGIPPGADLHVRGQAGVYETLGICDRPFVELCDPSGQRLHKGVQLGVG